MLDLQKIRNIAEEINESVVKRCLNNKIPVTSVETKYARIISQEKDGSILYTCDDISGSEGAVVTHFCLYNPISKKSEVVHVYNQCAHVVSYSINQDRTLIAFSIMTKDGLSAESVKKTGKEKCSAFLAEIKCENPRVFSLNLERQTFLKVQFLYNEKITDKESHMLVMIHRESIGLYRIPMATVANGMVLKGQPKTEHIAKKFSWCQWDCRNQLLYYIYKDADGNKQNMFTCVQFYSNAHHDNVLDVPLNFQISSHLSSRCVYTDSPLHTGIPDINMNIVVLMQSNGTLCICYQQQVLISENQRKSSPLPVTSPLYRSSPFHRSNSFQSSLPSDYETDNTDINYYICVVHHAKTLHGCVSGIPASVVRRATLSFSWFDDTLVVMLPGYFIHLLNLSIEFEPCNHILLHNKLLGEQNSYQSYVKEETGENSQTAGNQKLGEFAENSQSHAQKQLDKSLKDMSSSSDDADKAIPVMSLMAENLLFCSNAILHGAGRENSSRCLLERSSGDVYILQVNMGQLIKTFTHCYLSTTRSSLFHYILLKTKDFSVMKQLFLVLCNDIPSPEVTSLMTEFLIAMTYVAMRRQMDRDVLRMLPFTDSDTFRGQFDRNEKNEKLARFSYMNIESVNIVSTSAKERQHQKGDDWLDMLRNHLRFLQWNQIRNRFSLKMAKVAYKSMGRTDRKQLQNKEEEIFLASARSSTSETRKENATVGNYDSRLDAIQNTVPAFLHGSSVTDTSEIMMSVTYETLVKHLVHSPLKPGLAKANKVAKEYISCQQQQSRLLCQLLWTLKGQHLYEHHHDSLPSLLERGSLDEYELFQLLERYYLAASNAMFPIPQRFPSYFTAVAFKCLDIRLFQQYLNHDVVQLTGDFMVKLLTELPDNAEYSKIKMYLISKLPQSSANECYKHWDHITSSFHDAHQQVTEILSELTQRTTLDSSLSDTSRRNTFISRSNSMNEERANKEIGNVNFQPLAAFLRALQKLDKKIPEYNLAPQRHYAALAEVALYHTTHETSYKLDTVNF